ncbi:hypothetical protein [Bifidobacterium olomucense]|uniref:Uncharacterized protein n=1 Tax=Bifidobacterium olomucense TaxID=2675324 RepID=A0A7Y0EXD1_9BIFI|nr:hypothetical protein [Bifidobacterium sp. DSM 109959]NMM98150.1 hypothetical protein [Bifidobacterium sp. DSM 109959]
MPIGVITTNTNAPKEDQRWLVGDFGQQARAVTLDLTTFQGAKQNDYLANVPGDTDIYGWIQAGIPLVRIPASGLYGPYDPDATDGRNGKVEGFLRSQIQVQFGVNGWVGVNENIGMMYTGVIDTQYLPVSIDTATVGGFFLKYNEDGSVAPLTTLSETAPTATVDTLSGASDTGKTIMKAKDAATARTAIGAGTSNFSGSYNDLTNKPNIPAAPTWANIGGKPAAAAAIADLTAAPAAADVNKILAALRAFGIIAK